MTREEKRNKYAEEVCRELRYQYANLKNRNDSILLDLLLKWMNYAKQNKYERP